MRFRLWILLVLSIIYIFLNVWPAQAKPQESTASWYSRESCLREGTSGIMANGRLLDDNKYTCAKWGVPFGSRFRITNVCNGKSVIVICTDRGPAKHLVKQGRIIDLSVAAFKQLAPLSKGIIKVKVEPI